MSESPLDKPVVCYLGPRGTFTEQALHTQPDLVEMNHLRFGSIVENNRVGTSGTELWLAGLRSQIRSAD